MARRTRSISRTEIELAYNGFALFANLNRILNIYGYTKFRYSYRIFTNRSGNSNKNKRNEMIWESSRKFKIAQIIHINKILVLVITIPKYLVSKKPFDGNNYNAVFCNALAMKVIGIRFFHFGFRLNLANSNTKPISEK